MSGYGEAGVHICGAFKPVHMKEGPSPFMTPPADCLYIPAHCIPSTLQNLCSSRLHYSQCRCTTLFGETGRRDMQMEKYLRRYEIRILCTQADLGS